MKKRKALYFFVGQSTFVKKDIDIISEKSEVHTLNFEVDAGQKWKVLLQFVRQIFFLLRYGFTSTLFVSQFAGYHSLLPVLFAKITGKKSLIIAGGMECVAFPSIGYGNFQKKYLKNFTRWSLMNASHISPKHETLWHSRYTYTNDDFSEQGIQFFIPSIRTPHTVIYNGYDSIKFQKKGDKKASTFITVTGAMEYPFQTALKGIDLLLEVAKDFPKATFLIIGALSERQFPDRPSNVIVKPKVPNEKLIELYSESQFYFQLSMAEGFPNALCEAMLCECVPIGSDVFSISDIIDNTGFLLRKRNKNMLAEVVQKALTCDAAALGKSARERILKNYPLSRRNAELSSLIDKL